jgi:hypothetical protein
MVFSKTSLVIIGKRLNLGATSFCIMNTVCKGLMTEVMRWAVPVCSYE